MKPVRVRIGQHAYERLMAHLFPGDGDEHAAVLLCGVAETPGATMLLVRDVALATDLVDFVPSSIAYRMLTSAFVAKWISRAADERLCYLAVHNHGGSDSVAFSWDDLTSHEAGYPALLDIAGDGPVGALVFARNAVAGDVWFPEGRREVELLTVVGPRVLSLFPTSPLQSSSQTPDIYDRSIRVFGDRGQAILQALTVTIIGVGGGGSLANEWLARTGIGTIRAVDPDVIEASNIPRVVDATLEDVRCRLSKVKIAERVARRANPNIRFLAVEDDVSFEDIALQVIDSDVLILAGDNFTSRNVFNALCHQYLIPGFHVGVDIQPADDGLSIAQIKVESRVVLPQPGGGCLRCEGLIPAGKLQLEGLSSTERAKQGYFGADALDEVPEPSLMILNVMSVAPVVQDLVSMFTGLYPEGLKLDSQRALPLERATFHVAHSNGKACRHCNPETANSLYAMGDRASLPCKRGRVVGKERFLGRVLRNIGNLLLALGLRRRPTGNRK